MVIVTGNYVLSLQIAFQDYKKNIGWTRLPSHRGVRKKKTAVIHANSLRGDTESLVHKIFINVDYECIRETN